MQAELYGSIMVDEGVGGASFSRPQAVMAVKVKDSCKRCTKERHHGYPFGYESAVEVWILIGSWLCNCSKDDYLAPTVGGSAKKVVMAG